VNVRTEKIILLGLFVWLATISSAAGLDHVAFRRGGQEREVDGRVVVKARDGGLSLVARDGVIWNIQPDENPARTSDERPFVPMTPAEVAAELRGELPPGFDVHRTAHYVILYNSSKAYARWCGALFERLYMGFSTYWKRRGFALAEPEFPLVAVVFGNRPAYVQFARGDLGNAANSVLGYYNIETNRMTMCDLTGISSFARGRRVRSATEINAILSRPEALMTVATIVHEATHQIAYNRGMHTRFGDCPLWLSEGLAVFFETPDLSSDKGWSGIGEVNRLRLAEFAKYMARRPADSLATLIGKDDRFRNTTTAGDAYAEAWALTYFLVRNRSADYLKYLKLISHKKPFVWDSPETRVKEFESVFGDLDTVNREFLRAMQRLW
jgi:hypothetical protein